MLVSSFHKERRDGPLIEVRTLAISSGERVFTDSNQAQGGCLDGLLLLNSVLNPDSMNLQPSLQRA